MDFYNPNMTGARLGYGLRDRKKIKVCKNNFVSVSVRGTHLSPF
jgi:hypothetical protein